MAALGAALAAVLGWLLRDARSRLLVERAGNASLKPYADRLDALRQFLWANSAEPFFQIDPEMRLNGANTTGELLLGQRGVQMVGRPLSSFLDPECPGLKVLTEAIIGGKELKKVRTRLVPRKGFDAGDVEITTRRAVLDGRDEWWVHLRLLGKETIKA